ncbi:MAG: glycosyltransferase family 2 protein [Candidatus Aenigmatarchaeota archaeon]
MVSITPFSFSPSYVLDSIFYFKKGKNFEKRDYTISAIVPARNEERNIGKCLDSLISQLYEIEKIIVVNDGSTDKTGEIVKSYESQKVKVIENEKSLGKTASITKALKYVESYITLFVDGDTYLKENFTDEIRTPFSDEKVAGATGTIFSQKSEFSFIENARLVEYIYYQYFRKVGQSNRRALYTVAGCASAFRTKLLKEYGIPRRSVTEDTDLTWFFQERGYDIIYWPEAIAYTKEPKNFRSLLSQLNRWYSGMWQNLYIHGENIVKGKKPRLATTVWLQVGENLIFSLFWLSLPLLLYFYPDWGTSFLIMDSLSLLVPNLYHANKLKMVKKVAKSLPYYYLLRTMNTIAAIKGFFQTSYEWLKGKREWSH